MAVKNRMQRLVYRVCQ